MVARGPRTGAAVQRKYQARRGGAHTQTCDTIMLSFYPPIFFCLAPHLLPGASTRYVRPGGSPTALGRRPRAPDADEPARPAPAARVARPVFELEYAGSDAATLWAVIREISPPHLPEQGGFEAALGGGRHVALGARPRTATLDELFLFFSCELRAAAAALPSVGRAVQHRSGAAGDPRVLGNLQSASASNIGKANDVALGGVLARFLACAAAEFRRDSSVGRRLLIHVLRMQAFARRLVCDEEFFDTRLHPSMGVMSSFVDTYAELYAYHGGVPDVAFDGRTLRSGPEICSARAAARARGRAVPSHARRAGPADPRTEARRRSARETSSRRAVSFKHLRFLARAAAIALHAGDFAYIDAAVGAAAAAYARDPRAFLLDPPCAVASVAAILMCG